MRDNEGVKEKGIYELLKTRDKGIHSSQGVLSKLFRIMLVNYDISPVVYDRLLSSYIKRHNLPASERGNFNKSILRDIMSIKTWLKALDFLGITDIKITVEARRVREKTPLTHTLEVNNIQSLLKRRRTKDDNYL